MKKLTVVLFCFALLIPLISGCGIDPVDAYYNTVEEMTKIQEQKFSFSFDVESDSLSQFGSSITLTMDGAVSVKNKQMTATMTLTTASPKMTVELTDIIFDNSKLYINMETLFSAIFTLPGMESTENPADYLDEYMGGNKYLYIDYADLALPIWDYNNQSNHVLLQRPLDVIDNAIKSANPPIITADGNAYIMEMNGEFIRTLLFTLINDLEENLDTYTDNILDIIDEYTSYMEKLDMPEDFLVIPDDISRSELKNQLQEYIPYIRDMLEDIRQQQWDALKYYSYVEKNKDAYTNNIEVNSEDIASLSISYSANKADIAAIELPEKAIAYSEILERIQSAFSDLSDVDFDDDYSIYDEKIDIDYSIIQGATNPRLLDADVEDCQYFQLYTMTSGATDTEYNIANIIEEDAYVGSYYFSTEAEGVSISYNFDDLYFYDGIVALLEENVVNDLSRSSSAEYTNLNHSDMWISADGSFALMSCAADDSWGYRDWVIYGVYYTGNKDDWDAEEVICLEISLWDFEKSCHWPRWVAGDVHSRMAG